MNKQKFEKAFNIYLKARLSIKELKLEASLEVFITIHVRVPHDVVGAPEIVVHIEAYADKLLACEWLQRDREDVRRVIGWDRTGDRHV